MAVVGDILQPTHLLFVLIVALVVLGPKRLPEVARTLGDGLRDFKNAINGEHRDHDAHDDEDDGYRPPDAGRTDEAAFAEAPASSSAEAPGANHTEPEHAAPTPKPAEPPPA
ncbi:MAG: twin-arginine translocase TatA/TatE family subunit [Solirubrobacteraceae bacterium]